MHPHVPPAVTLLILVTIGYSLWAFFVPFKKCRRCHGYGRTPTRSGRGQPKLCRRCDGQGIRPRLFRRPKRAVREMLRDARSEVRR